MRDRFTDNATALVIVGFLLVQVGWLFAVPPVRGIDEFDHIYRAAAVADGQWFAEPSSVTRGTGAELVVPPDIISATRAECQELPYVGPEECLGRRTERGVVVPGGAGRYNPAYYAVVGLPSTLLDGTTAVYAMRILSMLLCAGALALALTGIRRPDRSPATVIGVVLAVTPMIAYSSIVIAPNALEILSGLLLWVAWTGLLRSPTPTSALVVRLGLAGALLVVLRPLGPLWCLLILLTGLLTVQAGLARVRALLGSRQVLVCAATTFAFTMLGVAWTLASQALEIGREVPKSDSVQARLETVMGDLPLWVFQAIGAFPYRANPAPMIVYASFLVLLIGFIGTAIVRGRGAQRVGLLLVCVLTLLVPASITWLTYSDFVDSWQGRYTLPFAVGLGLLAGYVLHDRGTPPWMVRPALLGVLVVTYSVGHVAGPLRVQRQELDISPGVDNGQWILVGPWAVGAAVALGAAMMVVGALSTERQGARESTTRVPVPVGQQ